jgi:hypothetical protein
MNNKKNDKQLIEKLARAVHDVFYEEMKELGYTYDPVTNEKKKTHSSLIPFTQLPDDEQEQNRDNACDIWNKLESIGYRIVPVCNDLAEIKLTDEEIEKLAEKEHERWMKQKIAAGWTYAPKTDKRKKLHKGIVPYKQLSEEEKDKDRVLVQAIPKILNQAGYIMIKKVA